MFKIKDLMVRVIPEEGLPGDLGGAGACGDCTCGSFCGSCSCSGCTFATCVGCTYCSPPSGMGLGLLDRVNPADLAALKAQLKERVAAVERLEAGFTPQTREQAEMLERKLTDALAEVKRIKASLTKAPKSRK